MCVCVCGCVCVCVCVCVRVRERERENVCCVCVHALRVILYIWHDLKNKQKNEKSRRQFAVVFYMSCSDITYTVELAIKTV